MFIPIGTDRPTRRRPRVTEALIVLNLLVYLFGLAGNVFGWISFDQLTDWMMLSKTDFHVYNLFTYQFAHNPSDILHLVFNMVGLWIFGVGLEDRLGHVSFLAFYLIGGCVAGAAHMMDTPAPVIGASGSVCALIGGFIALFPRSRIRILLIFLVIGIFEIGSLWVVGFYVLVDFVGWVGPSGSSVAYIAHIAGYVYGFILAVSLLLLKIIRSEDFDILFLWKQSRRRAAFRNSITQKGAAPWEAPGAAPSQAQEEHVDPEAEARAARISTARQGVIRLVRESSFEEAGTEYEALLELDPQAVLPEAMQLDLANRLYATGDRLISAKVYERFLERYPRSSNSHEVQLILGLIYARVLERPEEAQALLMEAVDELDNEGHRSLANTLLKELVERGRSPGTEPTA